VNRAEKRTSSLEEKACRLKAVPVEIKLLTVLQKTHLVGPFDPARVFG
jgi:hypothetical protein